MILDISMIDVSHNQCLLNPKRVLLLLFQLKLVGCVAVVALHHLIPPKSPALMCQLLGNGTDRKFHQYFTAVLQLRHKLIEVSEVDCGIVDC